VKRVSLFIDSRDIFLMSTLTTSACALRLGYIPSFLEAPSRAGSRRSSTLVALSRRSQERHLRQGREAISMLEDWDLCLGLSKQDGRFGQTASVAFVTSFA
jgi:hypothetical protein